MQDQYKSVRIWLLVVYFTILLMVMVGGITRLTGSGLSIVDWRPITGAIPPLNEGDWMIEFNKYKTSPQFKDVNFMMSLSEFKGIYFWEYFHRLLGRMIGMIFFIPLIYFWVKKKLTGPLLTRGLIAMVLGGAQGALGWFMVKSGLVKDPAVSHYRLYL
jgi:cytochrome c oxidase assembly protein subunit 15